MDRRLELIAEMTPAIWVHLLSIVPAIVIGGYVLYRRKGDARHKLLGRRWVALMLVAAISSFWVTEIRDGFSPIHLLSAYTLFSVTAGVWVIRSGPRTPRAMRLHRNFMQSLYATGILIAGGFTFLPNRLLGRLTFGETMPAINYAFVAIVVAMGLWLLINVTRRQSVVIDAVIKSLPNRR
ncbi:MAG: DUF2306 domain-containing protein [Pseudomonadota bacterium]